ncbi:hypothetical protein N656DRAFT_773799 [Canariomyces notabilis]|uniref:Uncharacterized protein n=1 Tax=Canariomyces notabilis TaxID=2074819 RepID=A0AAN6TNC2_9PEZI|nr:hypothetical protein N656DRAFT_773799 [Canariomyces arenarius]
MGPIWQCMLTPLPSSPRSSADNGNEDDQLVIEEEEELPPPPPTPPGVESLLACCQCGTHVNTALSTRCVDCEHDTDGCEDCKPAE